MAATAALAAAALAVSSVAIAFAASGGPTVRAVQSAHLGEQILVDAHGRTLYALSPETTGHLLCKSGECLSVWPPLTVRSRKTKLHAGPGVHGSLGILRRSNGALQVTLRGMPLYRYAGDAAPGQTNGQGKHGFGGTWHAISAVSNAGKVQTPTTTAPGSSGGSGAGETGSGGYPSPPSTPTSGPTTPPTTPGTPPPEEKTAPKEPAPKEPAPKEPPKEEPKYW